MPGRLCQRSLLWYEVYYKHIIFYSKLCDKHLIQYKVRKDPLSELTPPYKLVTLSLQQLATTLKLVVW